MKHNLFPYNSYGILSKLYEVGKDYPQTRDSLPCNPFLFSNTHDLILLLGQSPYFLYCQQSFYIIIYQIFRKYRLYILQKYIQKYNLSYYVANQHIVSIRTYLTILASNMLFLFSYLIIQYPVHIASMSIQLLASILDNSVVITVQTLQRRKKCVYSCL